MASPAGGKCSASLTSALTSMPTWLVLPEPNCRRIVARELLVSVLRWVSVADLGQVAPHCAEGIHPFCRTGTTCPGAMLGEVDCLALPRIFCTVVQESGHKILYSAP